MKKFVINSALIGGFIITTSLIIVPLAAEIQFGIAQKAGARTNYGMAIRLDPFNSEYFAGFGRFLYRQSAFREDRLACFQRAESLYKKAIKLNPKCADYYLGLGLAELMMYRDFSAKTERTGLDALKSAVQNDPNGFNICYSAGYAGLMMWEYLSQVDREFVLERLKYSLKLWPHYSQYIYPLMWQKTKDFGYLKRITPKNLKNQNDLYYFIIGNKLFQFRKEQTAAVDFYRQKEEKDKFEAERSERSNRISEMKKTREKSAEAVQIVLQKDWQGKSNGGACTYKDGNMYWEGTIDGVLAVPAGNAIIAIQAKGSPADGIYPYMVVSLDGEEIGETFVGSGEWQEYSFKINTNGGTKVLSMTFINDGGSKKGEDRNLYVGEAKVASYGK